MHVLSRDKITRLQRNPQAESSSQLPSRNRWSNTPSQVPSVLTIRNARKAFGPNQALRGASFELRERELLALLGPNGAGKTTLIRAIAGRVKLDEGEIELFGQKLDLANGRRELAVVPQELALYGLLTARENLDAFGRLNGVTPGAIADKVKWALDWTGLADRADEPVRNFSGGMKRRLNLACSVLHDPKILLLDEPTVGVDPQSREKIYDMLEKLRANGMSLMVTTHHLEEAEARCERIVVIDHGSVIASGTLKELLENTVGHLRSVTLTLDRPMPHGPAGCESADHGRVWHTRVADVATELPGLIQNAQAAGCRVENIEVRSPNLQAAFIALTGKDLRE